MKLKNSLFGVCALVMMLLICCDATPVQAQPTEQALTSVQIVDSQGKPATDATVVLFKDSRKPTILNGKVQNADQLTTLKVSEDGSATIQAPKQQDRLLVLAANGYKLVNRADVTSTITLSSWGKVTGKVMIADQVGADQLIRLTGHINGPSCNVEYVYQVRSDVQGKFELDQLPSGRHDLKRIIDIQQQAQIAAIKQWVYVQAGKTTQTQLGGMGRTMQGRVVWECAKTTFPINHGVFFLMSKSNTAPSNTYQFLPNADGTFQITDVLPGEYKMASAFIKPHVENHFDGKLRVSLQNESIVVPAISESQDAATALVSKDHVVPMVRLSPRAGEMAMDFDVTLLDPKSEKPFNVSDAPRFKLSDCKGKVVVIQFWATWCGNCVKEMVNLKEVWDTFGSNEHFEMISLALNGSPQDPSQFVLKKNYDWKQGYLGDWDDSTPVVGDYGVKSIPRIFMIAPDGSIQGSLLRGDNIFKTVQQEMIKHQFIAAQP